MISGKMWSIRTKIMLVMVLIVLVPMAIATLVSTRIVASRMSMLIEENVNTAAKTASEILGELRDRLLVKAKSLSTDPELLLYLTTRRDESIREILSEKMKAMDVSELTISDPQGIVIGCGHRKEYGDDESSSPDIKIAIAGQVYIGPQVEKEGVMFLSATLPIKSGEEIIGIIDVDERVDQSRVDRIKGITGMDLTEFQGSKIAATTITGTKGERATALPDAEEIFERIRKGEEGFDFDLEINGEKTESRCFSLKGPGGDVIGFYMVSTPITKALKAQATARDAIIITTLLSILGAAIFGLFLSRGISVPILKGALRITTAANQILTASQQQATGIEEEATQISQTATSSKQLATTSKQVADLSNEISKSSISSVQMANSGVQSVDIAIAGMEKIKSSVLETSKKIEGLSEKGQAISEVVTLIDDIANQTNLLSLNASIEAARAGEAGKGFAVVADAIGKLSDRTTKSTKDISDLIKGIQQDTSGCVMSMEESTKETEKGSLLAQEAGRAIKELVSGFEHVAQSAKEILLASQQQISGATQISKGMMGIDDIMKQSAAGAKQSTESARELVTLADEFKKIIGGGELGGKDEEKI